MAIPLIALPWGCAFSVALYAVMRIVEVTAGTEPDPARQTWSVHAGFVWRTLTVLYAGGIATAIAALLVRLYPARAARSLPSAILVASGLLVVQALFFP